MSVIVLSTLMVMSVAFLQISSSQTRAQVSSVDKQRAEYLAEAGVVEAIVAIRGGGTGSVGSMAAPTVMGDGILWVTATVIDVDHTRLTAVAAHGSGRSALEVIVERVKAVQFPGAFASKSSIGMNQDVVVDSYDSTLGSYAVQLAARAPDLYVNANAIVATNGKITVGGGAIIYGDATPGPTESVSISATGLVTGSTAPALDAFVYQPVVVPALAPGGDLVVAAGTTVTLPAGDHRFNSVTLGAGATLTIAGPSKIVVDQDFDMGASGTLQLGSPGQAVEVYAEGDIRWGAGCLVDTPGSAATLVALYAVGGKQNQQVDLGATTQFHGTVYAPDAFVTLTKDFELFGAIAAAKLNMLQQSKVHYDEALGLQAIGGGGDRFARRTWQTTNFPDGPLKQNGRDPFMVLNLDKDALPMPSEAWEMPPP